MPSPSNLQTTLEKTHSPVKFSIHTSTQISRRTSAVLANLQPGNNNTNEPSSVATNNSKSPIIILTAPPKATNKLLSIVEITKRDLASRKIKCFQYNALSSELIDIPRGKSKAKDEGASESDDAAFETMGERELGETKKRNVPVLTVYLALESVRELRGVYGEQTT